MHKPHAADSFDLPRFETPRGDFQKHSPQDQLFLMMMLLRRVGFLKARARWELDIFGSVSPRTEAAIRAATLQARYQRTRLEAAQHHHQQKGG